MIEVLTAPFAFEFMRRAFIAALIVGALCSAVGTYVVLRKLSFIGDGIAHASFAGIVIAYLRGFDYAIGSAVVAVATAVGISVVHRRAHVSLDTAIGVLFTAAFALGIFLMSRSPRYSVDLQAYLFGNILGVSTNDLIFVLAVGACVIATIVALYRPLLYTSFDPVVAEASGIRVRRIDDALLVLVALTIVVSIQSVGIVLVAALLVTPAAAAAQLTRRFLPMMLLSIAIGAASSLTGLYVSYYLGSASGATIVLVATLAFLAALTAGRLNAARRSRLVL